MLLPGAGHASEPPAISGRGQRAGGAAGQYSSACRRYDWVLPAVTAGLVHGEGVCKHCKVHELGCLLVSCRSQHEATLIHRQPQESWLRPPSAAQCKKPGPHSPSRMSFEMQRSCCSQQVLHCCCSSAPWAPLQRRCRGQPAAQLPSAGGASECHHSSSGDCGHHRGGQH